MNASEIMQAVGQMPCGTYKLFHAGEWTFDLAKINMGVPVYKGFAMLNDRPVEFIETERLEHLRIFVDRALTLVVEREAKEPVRICGLYACNSLVAEQEERPSYLD